MTDGAAIQINSKYEVIYCYKCRIPFAVPAAIRRRWVEDGDSFYCPNGHSQYYTESDVQRLEKQLERERRRREFAEHGERRFREQSEAAERRSRAYKGHLTRIKKRVGAGTCPCCQRHFKQLAAHMENKHPHYRGEDQGDGQ